MLCNRIIVILLICMAADYLTGMIRATVFKRDKHGGESALESRVGFKGILRKVVMLAICCVSAVLDRLLGIHVIYYPVTIGFIVNEAVSIVENAGIIGIPIPEKLARAIKVLKEK